MYLLTQSSAFAVPPTFHAFFLAIFHAALGARTKLWGIPWGIPGLRWNVPEMARGREIEMEIQCCSQENGTQISSLKGKNEKVEE